MASNVNAVIDSIVRQTTILIAQLATTAGLRAPLAHIANQIFLDLVGELERQGVGRKVIADMFGLALRSYQQKVQRLNESATDRGMTLWEAVFDYMQKEEVANRADILRRFRYDNEASVRGILNDLVESGLVYRTGRGDGTIYRITSEDDVGRALSGDSTESAAALIWVAVHRDGPVSRKDLLETVPVEEKVLDTALARLLDEGRIRETESAYESDQCLIPLGDGIGWEAAVLDHYQALVHAIVTKLRNGKSRALPDDRVGGSTFSFDVWPGHPNEDEVYGLLGKVRDEVIELWDRVTAHNDDVGRDKSDAARVTFYFGQDVRVDDAEEGEES